MTRPVQSDSADTLERILSAALALLDDGGPDALSFRKLATATGLSVGSIRYYFDSRDALLEYCLDDYHERLVQIEQEWTNALQQGGTPQEMVVGAVAAAVRFLADARSLVRLRVWLTMRDGALSSTRRALFREPFVERTTLVLQTITGRDTLACRLTVDSVMRLVTYYAAISGEEAMSATGVDDEARARELLAKQCCDVAVQLVFGAPA